MISCATNVTCRSLLASMPFSGRPDQATISQLTYAATQVVSSQPHLPIFIVLEIIRSPKKRDCTTKTMTAAGM